MLLEPLCDVLWSYQLMRSVEPSTDGDGLLYGQGTARFTGRVAGEAQWSNSPRLRGRYAFPDAHGVIDLAADECLLFTVSGMSSLADGRGVHVMTFRTGSAPLSWLNNVLAVGEGSIDTTRGVLAMRYYECVVDHLPAIGTPPAADRA